MSDRDDGEIPPSAIERFVDRAWPWFVVVAGVVIAVLGATRQL